MMFWYGDGMSGWGYVLMTVAMVLFWALVIAGIVLLVRALSPGPQVGPPPVPPPVPEPTPESILATRFAHGEIDEDEFRRCLEVLHSHRPGHPST
ncbi:SHOCT domain-containing protein [Rhodococcus zopfii]|uniref:SHOCT domain-containing protein n=1 Tax=unclassified Rhodococcus (in: high G+C Gram-positive bacteria) TaxID=192944 RepID=UPI0018CD689E|nr:MULTISPECIES: SHOCT domain-containing protein [unclassified Rhodococcus (in: high G+C Gram-positive bacteria)]MBH0123742.1 SHOCT domain-containing protein [Rhodococcus sp. CX]MCK8671167.1 SHOCT domain-containing protein [Rhodococcus sp. HM1]